MREYINCKIINTSYDNDFIEYFKENNINFNRVKSQNKIDNILEENFQFDNVKVNFSNLKNETYIKSNNEDISKDTINFVKSLIEKGLCSKFEQLIYIGDNLTNNYYEIYVEDIIRVLPFILDTPQHHYFLFNEPIRLILVSFEDEIEFGMI
ncbi:MAG: hypothetical protein FWF50_00085 [Defluviitaleaceae bacterium]|nr:hypothetical protein [Defluviitaleaceae bacterium]